MPRIITPAFLGLLLCSVSACMPTKPAVLNIPAVSGTPTVSGTPAVSNIPAVSEIPADYEIEDVRRLPQQFGSELDRGAAQIPDGSCREYFVAEFTRRYYSPWRGNKPLSNLPRSIKIMKEHAAREWYGENRRKVPRRDLERILANCDLDRFPSMTQPAVALVPTAVRVLPTAWPFFEKADDFPFDSLQNAGLKMNEPIRILHLSRDGVWAFVETADANGWVELRDIANIDEAAIQKRIEMPQAVIVKELTQVGKGRGEATQLVKVGTLFSITGETQDRWEVSVPVSGGGGQVLENRVNLSKGAAVRFPLEMSRENLRLVGNEFIDRPYGWGELFQGRDCSSLIRDYFIPFGIWFPRGSFNQINSGKKVKLSSMSPAEKEGYIRENGIPFLTLIGMKGHIMLYIGTEKDRPLVFHSLWGVEIRKADGSVSKQVVGKSIISTLTPGRELPLAVSILDKVDSMLTLIDRCPKPGH